MTGMDDMTPKLHDLIDGRLPDEEARALKARIDRDPELRRRYRELELVVGGLHGLADERAPDGFADRVLSSVARLDAPRAGGAPRPVVLRLVSRYGAVAAAFLAVLVIGILLSSRFGERSGSFEVMSRAEPTADGADFARAGELADDADDADDPADRFGFESGVATAPAEEMLAETVQEEEVGASSKDKSDGRDLVARRAAKEARPSEPQAQSDDPSALEVRSRAVKNEAASPESKAKGGSIEGADESADELAKVNAEETAEENAVVAESGGWDAGDAEEDGDGEGSARRLLELLGRLSAAGTAAPPDFEPEDLELEDGALTTGALAGKLSQDLGRGPLRFRVVSVATARQDDAREAARYEQRGQKKSSTWDTLLAGVPHERLEFAAFSSNLPIADRGAAAGLLGARTETVRIVELDPGDLPLLVRNAAAAGWTLNGLGPVPDARRSGFLTGSPRKTQAGEAGDDASDAGAAKGAAKGAAEKAEKARAKSRSVAEPAASPGGRVAADPPPPADGARTVLVLVLEQP